MAIEIRDGDIFRWRYQDESPRPFTHDIYWCKSRIATARNGVLRDTYWYGTSDNAGFGQASHRSPPRPCLSTERTT